MNSLLKQNKVYLDLSINMNNMISYYTPVNILQRDPIMIFL